jgi:hypothetical protein
MKMINRRKFMLIGVASFASTSVAPISFANTFINFIEPVKNKKMFAYFENKLNDNFIAVNEEHSFGIKLSEVREYSASNNLEQFELIFKANSKIDKSGLYQVSRKGTLETQLIRLDQRGEKNNYSATFNLLI